MMSMVLIILTAIDLDLEVKDGYCGGAQGISETRGRLFGSCRGERRLVRVFIGVVVRDFVWCRNPHLKI